jgi:hypothetical protein
VLYTAVLKYVLQHYRREEGLAVAGLAQQHFAVAAVGVVWPIPDEGLGS